MDRRDDCRDVWDQAVASRGQRRVGADRLPLGAWGAWGDVRRAALVAGIPEDLRLPDADAEKWADRERGGRAPDDLRLAAPDA